MPEHYLFAFIVLLALMKCGKKTVLHHEAARFFL